MMQKKKKTTSLFINGYTNNFFQDIIQYPFDTHKISPLSTHPLIPTTHAPPPTNLISPLASRLSLPTSPPKPQPPRLHSIHIIPAEKKQRKRCNQTPLSAHARFARHTPCLPNLLQPRLMRACMSASPAINRWNSHHFHFFPLPRSGVFRGKKGPTGKQKRKNNARSAGVVVVCCRPVGNGTGDGCESLFFLWVGPFFFLVICCG